MLKIKIPETWEPTKFARQHKYIQEIKTLYPGCFVKGFIVKHDPEERYALITRIES